MPMTSTAQYEFVYVNQGKGQTFQFSNFFKNNNIPGCVYECNVLDENGEDLSANSEIK